MGGQVTGNVSHAGKAETMFNTFFDLFEQVFAATFA
jgi:hypothetical protein